MNLTGVWRTVKAAVPAMVAGGEGGAITITSSAAGSGRSPTSATTPPPSTAWSGSCASSPSSSARTASGSTPSIPGAVDTPMGHDPDVPRIIEERPSSRVLHRRPRRSGGGAQTRRHRRHRALAEQRRGPVRHRGHPPGRRRHGRPLSRRLSDLVTAPLPRRKPFRFGVQASRPPGGFAGGADAGDRWRELARRVEDLGLLRAHRRRPPRRPVGPVPALMAAAEATTTLRVGALVLCNDYRHPVGAGQGGGHASTCCPTGASSSASAPGG